MSDLISSTQRIPKYIMIAESLKADMERGTLSPGDQLPSFNEMTEQFRVAKHTIDKAHALLEKEGLVRREQGRGVFVEASKARQTGNIGLLLLGATQHDAYTSELVAGVQKQARTDGLGVMLVDENVSLSRQNIDGILLFCNSYDVSTLKLPKRLPRVLLLSPAAGLNIANVVADDFSGAKMATRHLLQLGHRRISFMLAAEYDPYSQQRLAGYRAALDEFGVAFDDRLCFYINKIIPNASDFLFGEEYMNRWLKSGWQKLNATAILATNDAGAFGIMKALNSVGFETPDDVSVVGYDGVGIGSGKSSPLTTIQVPLRKIGVAGMKLLGEQIQNERASSQQIVLPVQLKIGQSTAPV
jgi:DNA-binding LacI/PurR family transcriptional regulator